MRKIKDEIIRVFDFNGYKEYYRQELGGTGKINSSGWTRFLCPFHADTNPSFDVNFLREGAYRCHSCGETGDIFTFHQKKNGVSFKETLEYFAKFLGINPLKIKNISRRQNKKKKPLGKPNKIYKYVDLDGKTICETCRYSNPKTFRQRRPHPTKKGQYLWNLNGVEVIPYNLAAVVESKTVFVVEGEKDADSLEKINLVGTCNPMGAGKWWPSMNHYFKDKHVVILPDNDEPGEKHARVISDELYNTAKSIKIIFLPGLPDRGDVTDWLAAGNTHETLLKLVNDARAYQNHIDWLNSRHAVIMIGGKFNILNHEMDPVFGRPTVTFSSIRDFYNRYSNKKTINPNAGQKGQGKKISIAADWMQSSDRREYDGIVFDPEKETNGVYNLWKGFEYEPEKGDWSLFKSHIKNVIAGGNSHYYKWIITWMARIIQHPGGKRPGTAIVLRGEQGVGKGVFLNNFGKLFGNHYFQANNQKHLTGRFNSHLKDVLFLFVDEGFWAGDKGSEGILKGLISEDTLSIEAKGRDTFTIKNNVNLAMASNNDWVVPSGLFERRFFVLDVGNHHQQDYPYFKKIKEELDAGGYQAMLYDLKRLDLSTAADVRSVPKTGALFDQSVESMTPVQKFWLERLRGGCIDDNRDGEEWLTSQDGVRIQTVILYKQYVEFCETLGIRIKKVDRQFGKELTSICPKKRRKSFVLIDEFGNEQRKWHYEFPGLQECRDLFEKKMGGIQYVWDEDLVFSGECFE